MLTKSNEKRTRRSLSHERWSTDGNCKMDGKMQSNKKGSPTFPQLHVSERTEPRVSQLNGDHATESGLTTQVLILKSLESNGDRRNYLSSWEENVELRLAVVSEGPAESRNTQVQDSGHSGDLPLDRAAAMSLPGFFFVERPRFVELPQARERVLTATGRPARQTAVDLGVQRREHGR